MVEPGGAVDKYGDDVPGSGSWRDQDVVRLRRGADVPPGPRATPDLNAAVTRSSVVDVFVPGATAAVGVGPDVTVLDPFGAVTRERADRSRRL